MSMSGCLASLGPTGVLSRVNLALQPLVAGMDSVPNVTLMRKIGIEWMDGLLG